MVCTSQVVYNVLILNTCLHVYMRTQINSSMQHDKACL